MKEGKHGRRGCCEAPFEVLGVLVDAVPNFEFTGDSPGHPFNAAVSEGCPYDVLGEWTANGTTGHMDVIPEVAASAAGSGQAFSVQAGKVPSSYPYSKCDLFPPFSSADPRATKKWVANIGPIGHHRFDVDNGDYMGGWGYVYRSRVTYVDGNEAHYTYVQRGRDQIDLSSPTNAGQFFSLPRTAPPYFLHGDHYVIKADDPTAVDFWNTDWIHLGPPFGSLRTAMQDVYTQNFPGTVFNDHDETDNFPNYWPCNSVSYSKDYYICSTYRPDVPDLDTYRWNVMRVKYGSATDGTIDEIFASDDMGDTGVTYQSPYLILLPAVRTYIDSKLDPSLQQCWVCAKTITGDPQLVLGPWTDKTWRDGGTGDDTVDLGDGTLSESAVQTIIIGDSEIGSQAASDFPDEDWSDIRVRCYNRTWDYTQQKCVDLLLFTTAGDPKTQTVTADFESGDIQHGINTEDSSVIAVGWEVADTSGLSLGWISDGSAPISGEGSYSALADISFTFADNAILKRTFNCLTAGNITFKYVHDNREYAVRGDQGSALVNLPVVENSMQFIVNGVVIKTVDMVNYPLDATGDPDKFTATYDESIPVAAGTVTFEIKVNRVITGHNITSKVDTIAFPQEMIGDDVTGENRYYFDGVKVRKADQWAWAIRDDEGDVTAGSIPVDISTRVSTKPDSIAMLEDGRIAYGNPHWLCVTRDGVPDEDFGGDRYDDTKRDSGGGYIRFTASPNTDSGLMPPCYDPDSAMPTVDMVDDPRWGSFEILTPPRSGGFQVRGAAGAIRDLTEMPIPIRKYIYQPGDPEKWANNAKDSGHWTQRIHGWTFKDNGHTRRPHLMAIFRPTFSAPAHPEKVWPHPPYQSGFASSTLDTALTFHDDSAMRTRDDRFLTADSTAPRYSRTNWIMPSNYSDCFSRLPQFVWVRITPDPPNTDPDDGGWDPDTPPDGMGSPAGPWPSAQWALLQARQCPTGYYAIRVKPPEAEDALCPNVVDGTPVDHSAAVKRIQFAKAVPFPDFDALECKCDCCKPHGQVPNLSGLTF